MTDANKAIELIGKHLGMFKDKLELSGGMTRVEDMSEAGLA